MFHSALNHSPIVEHLGGFQEFPIMNRAAINIFLQIAYISFSVIFMVCIPRRGIIGSKARNTFMLLLQGARLLSRKTVLTCSSLVFLFTLCSFLMNSSSGCSNSSGPAWALTYLHPPEVILLRKLHSCVPEFPQLPSTLTCLFSVWLPS